MKLTQILQAQHIGRFLKKHWIIQGRKFPRETQAFKVLEKENIRIYDVKEILEDNEQRVIEKVDVISLTPEPVKFDETHPNYKERKCYTFGDKNVLVEGLAQAKVLTNTVELSETNGLPQQYILKNTSKDLDSRVKKIILNSHIFDAEQLKLPKIKDPLRPAFNFPRIYGVTYDRRMKLMSNRLLQLVEHMSGPQLSNGRYLSNNVQFQVPFEKFGYLMQFNLNADVFVSSKTPLKPVFTDVQTNEIEMPNLYPANERITLATENIYEIKDIYPYKKNVSKRHPHTIFAHFDKTQVANVYEEEVTEDQWLSRALLKSFTTAASYARHEYGEQVKKLPKPVTVQCVHTDGRLFNFGVFQLNTLDLELSNDTNGLRNIWSRTQTMPLFEKCEYLKGRPVLEGYNNEVIKHIFSFYDNNH